jgi:hypothetical protein
LIFTMSYPPILDLPSWNQANLDVKSGVSGAKKALHQAMEVVCSLPDDNQLLHILDDGTDIVEAALRATLDS